VWGPVLTEHVAYPDLTTHYESSAAPTLTFHISTSPVLLFCKYFTTFCSHEYIATLFLFTCAF
jgi:hypothetical protein